jgi:hypothetical protein
MRCIYATEHLVPRSSACTSQLNDNFPYDVDKKTSRQQGVLSILIFGLSAKQHGFQRQEWSNASTSRKFVTDLVYLVDASLSWHRQLSQGSVPARAVVVD